MKRSNTNIDFAFLAHWVEPWNWLLLFIDSLNRNPDNIKFWKFLNPFCGFMSVLYLYGNKSHDLVDEYNFHNLRGGTFVIRNFAWHFFKKGQRKKIIQRIFDAVLDAQSRGAKVIGLGALTKAEWLTRGGQKIVDYLGDNLKARIVHGDTLAAATVENMSLKIFDNFDIEQKIFLTGATSKIGRAVALRLAQKGIYIKLFTASGSRFRAIKKEAEELGVSHFISRTNDLRDGNDFAFWITGKAIPSGKELFQYIPKKAIVLNFSVPNPLTKKDLDNRKDIYSVEGGLLQYNPDSSDLKFAMRLPRGTVYACFAGTEVHAYNNWTHHEVGPVSLELMDQAWSTAMSLNYRLPPLPKTNKDS